MINTTVSNRATESSSRGHLTTGEDVELAARDVVPVCDVVLEVLCDDLLWQVSQPVSEL